MKKTPYLEGWHAYAKSKAKSDCPYNYGVERNEWLDGWLDARDAGVSQRKSGRKKDGA